MAASVAGALGQAVESIDGFRAGDFGELHALGVAGLEAHGGARGNIQAHAEGLRAVEAQLAVGLEEMEMRADLDGPVAGVGDVEFDDAAVRVGDDGFGS